MTTPATIVGARSGCRPGISIRSASGAEASCESIRWIERQLQHVAVDPLGVVGLELHLDRGQRGRRAGDRDPRLGARRRPPPAASIRPRTSAASASSSTAVGGSEADVPLACGGRRRPAARRGRRSRSPVPTISSVEPPPMSITSVGIGGASLRGGAEVGEPRLLLAVEHAGREREALPQLGDEGAAVLGVAHGAGRDRVDRLDPQLADRRDVVADRRAGVLDRLRREPAGEVDAAAQPRHRAAPLDRRDPPVRRRRRPAAAPSWCRRRLPRPVGVLGHRGTLESAKAAKPPVQSAARSALTRRHCYHLRSAAGWSSQVARRAHNPKVAGSNPAPAISGKPLTKRVFVFLGDAQNRPKNALGQRLGQHEV